MANAIRKKIFTSTYTETDLIDEFKFRFPFFIPIYNGAQQDITDTVLSLEVDIAILLLPEGMACYFDAGELRRIVQYMLAHLLAYAGISNTKGVNNNGTAFVSLMRLASSKSADGLSISYTDIAEMKGNNFANLLQFLSTTSYGQKVAIWIAKMNGSVGVYAA